MESSSIIITRQPTQSLPEYQQLQTANQPLIHRRIASIAIFLLGNLQFVPGIPRPMRLAAVEIVQLNNMRAYSRAMASHLSIQAKALESLKFFVESPRLSLLEDAPFLAGNLPESRWYQAALELIDMSLFITSFPLPAQFAGLIWLALDRPKQYVDKEKIAKYINNAAYLDKGLFDRVLSRTVDPQDEMEQVQRYQAIIAKKISHYQPAQSLDLDCLTLLTELVQRATSMNNRELLVWTRWHLAIYYASHKELQAAVQELKEVAAGRQNYSYLAAQWLARICLIEGNYLESQFWTKQAEYINSESNDSKFQEFEKEYGELDLFKQLFPDTVQRGPEECKYTTRNDWGNLVSIPLFMLKAVSKAHRLVVPTVVAAANLAIYGDPSKNSTNYAEEYKRAVLIIIHSLSASKPESNSELTSKKSTLAIVDDLANRRAQHNNWYLPFEIDGFGEDFSRLTSRFNELLKGLQQGKFSKQRVGQLLQIKKQFRKHDVLREAFEEKLFYSFIDYTIGHIYGVKNYFAIARQLIDQNSSLYRNLMYFYSSHSPVNAIHWLVQQFLLPNKEQITKEHIAEALSELTGKEINEHNVTSFLQTVQTEDWHSKPWHNLVCGMGALLLGIIDEDEILGWFDLASKRFHLNAPLIRFCFAKTGLQPLSQNIRTFQQIWLQFRLDTRPLIRQIELYLKLDIIQSQPLQKICQTIRTQLHHRIPAEMYAIPPRGIRDDLRCADQIKHYLPLGLDPNRPISTQLTRKESYKLFWHQITQREVDRYYFSHFAIETLDTDLLTSLLKFGADLSKLNMFGLDSIQWMLWYHHDRILSDSDTHAHVVKIFRLAREFGYQPALPMDRYLTKRPIQPHYLAELEQQLWLEYKMHHNFTQVQKAISNEIQPFLPNRLLLTEDIINSIQKFF